MDDDWGIFGHSAFGYCFALSDYIGVQGIELHLVTACIARISRAFRGAVGTPESPSEEEVEGTANVAQIINVKGENEVEEEVGRDETIDETQWKEVLRGVGHFAESHSIIDFS